MWKKYGKRGETEKVDEIGVKQGMRRKDDEKYENV